MPVDIWKQLKQRLIKKNIVMIGEIHGAAINPKIIAEFVRRLDIKIILIEVNTKYTLLFQCLNKKNINKSTQFIKKKDNWLFEAGVISQPHLLLYTKLITKGIKIIPVKVENRQWNNAERKTAIKIKKIMKKIGSGNRALLVFGNFHARKHQFILNNVTSKIKATPLGWLLRKYCTTIKIRYGKGEIYNFGRIVLHDQTALQKLKNYNMMLYPVQTKFFDFEYIVIKTKPLLPKIK